jgi:transposase
MKTLQFKEPAKIKTEILEEISRVKDGRYVRRLDAILLVAGGKNAYEVAEIFGYSPRSIHSWIKAINQTGDYTVLRDDERSGRPGKLSNKQKDELREIIKKLPSESGYDYARWDGKLLVAHIEKVYEITYSVRWCQKLFIELGFTYRRPRKMAHGGSEEDKDVFKKE